MKQLVSLITAVKNGEKYIKKCIESVLNQTYSNIEHIIVLGDSNDKTNEIVSEFSKNRSIKIVTEPRRGIYSALNYGIKNSHGNYIMILGSDDWIEPNCIHDLLSMLLHSSADFAVGYANVFADNSATSTEPLKIFKVNNFDERMLLGEMPFCHQALLASKYCFEICGLFDETLTLAADHVWIQRLFLNNLKIAILPKLVVNFTMGGASSNEELARTELTTSICRKFCLPYQEVWEWLEFITGNDVLRPYGVEKLIRSAQDINVLKSLSLHLLNKLIKINK